MTIENLEKELRDGKLNSMYLLYGEEIFLLENSLKKIKKLFGEMTLGINYIVLNETNYQELISDLETPAFGYSKKIIVCKNTGLFKKEGKKKDTKLTEYKEKLSQYIEKNIDNINDTIVLVFIEEEIEKSKLYNLIEKQGSVCNFELLKPIEVCKRIKAICNAYKVNINDTTTKYLIEACGTNMQILINEARKLIEYAGEDGTISIEDIDKLCIKQIDSVIFYLTDALGKKDIQKSMEILHNLKYKKEPLQKILITLYNHLKKLYIIKIAEINKKDIADSLTLKPNQMFLINKYKTQANFFDKNELRNILQQLIDLDSNYKVGLIDLEVGLESILCSI